jgi:hypothetical protein
MVGNFQMLTVRKVKPAPGHKCLGAVPAVEVYCECGWVSCPHTGERARTEAYAEWRDHARSHGGEEESFDTWYARDQKERTRLYGKDA